MRFFKTTAKAALSFILALMLCLSFVGCAPKTPDDENSLEIYATSAGYGIQWINDLIPIFEAQNPGTKVYLNFDIGVELCKNKVLAGPTANTADLLISLEDWQGVIMQGKKAVAGYDYALEDLTDFLNEKDENGVALRDKFLPYYLNVLSMELETRPGVYEYRDFALPYATSYLGIVYNKNLFQQNGWQIPRTTDELIKLCDTIKAAGKIPFTNETKTGYINYLTYCLFAQYMGIEEYYDYFNPITEDDYYRYEKSSAESLARLYSMYVMDDLLNPSFGRLSKTAQEDDYGRAQGRVISGEGAMIIIGDWFDNEMSLTIEQAKKAGNNYESGMMRFPVISALSDKLSYWKVFYPAQEQNYRFARSGAAESAHLEKCDQLLSKIVEYIENGKEGALPSIEHNGNVVTVTVEDVEIVEEAMSYYTSLGSGHTMVIPAYASAKELAKKFVKLMYSETGIKAFLNGTSGGSLPVKYDITKWDGYSKATGFQKTVYNLVQSGKAVQHPHSISWRVSGLPLPRGKFYQYKRDNPSYLSPEYYWENDSLTRQQYLDLLRTAGLL